MKQKETTKPLASQTVSRQKRMVQTAPIVSATKHNWKSPVRFKKATAQVSHLQLISSNYLALEEKEGQRHTPHQLLAVMHHSALCQPPINIKKEEQSQGSRLIIDRTGFSLTMKINIEQCGKCQDKET